MNRDDASKVERHMTNGLLLDRDCVLVLIDFQEKLLPAIENRKNILENAIRLLKFSKIIDLPVLLTEQEKLGSTVPEITAELPDSKPIQKSSFSCFGSAEFAEKIDQINRNVLILTGIETHICVAQTALQAGPRTVHVVSDATSSRTLHNWSVGLERMRNCGAAITSTEMLIFELLKRAGTDQFRAALKLVK